MGKAVFHRIASVVLASPVFILADDLFQCGDTGGILRIQGNVIQPLLTSVAGVSAVDRSHGDGGKEGVGGIRDHFRDSGLDDQVEAEIQAVLGGMTMLISFRKRSGALGSHVVLQRILHAGGIVGKRRGERVDQGIRGKEVIAGLGESGCDGIGVVVAQTDRGQQIARLGIVELVQDHVLVGAVGFRFRVCADVGNLEIAEHHALHGIAVGLLTVAEVVDGAVIQYRFQGGVADAGGDVAVDHGSGGIIGVCTGQIVLVNVNASGATGVDGGGGDRGCVRCDGEREQDGNGHQNGAEALERGFHIDVLSYFD